MIIIDAEKFLTYLIFSKHIDGLTCGEVKEAIEMCKVDEVKVDDVLDKIKAEIEDCLKALDEIEKSGLNIYYPNEMSGRRLTYKQCLKFIDKYRPGSEET